MLPKSIIDLIHERYGKKQIFSADCAPLGNEIGISETTVKRMLGLVGPESKERYRVPHASTMEILAKWLGFDSYQVLLENVGEKKVSSEFTELDCIDVDNLQEGSRVRFSYHPAREVTLTYLGNDEFRVANSKNSKLKEGDLLKISHLIKGQELIVGDVMREGVSLGPFRGAKDGGLTSLEILGFS